MAHHCGSYTRSHYYQADLEKTKNNKSSNNNSVYADAVFADPALRNEGEPKSGSSETRPQSHRRTQNAGPVMVDPIYANPALNNEGEPNSGSSEKREKPQRAKAGAASEDAARQTMIREDELNTPVTPVNRNTSTPQPKTPATQNCPHPCCLRHCPRPCCQDGEVTTARGCVFV
ncbi:hypothetical protein GCK32_005091 [Trichostrongylus colubriformis]|uniref:Uncharacterized protein n=1 Tax=Trichostrongylus colubriformis TaxID=6319 RepID=A0AAN8IWR1_TRICO